MRERVMRGRRPTLLVLGVVSFLLGAVGLVMATGQARGAGEVVYVLTLDGIVNPVATRYLERGIDEGEADGAAAVMIELDTPGGLLGATHELTTRMLGADVPVVVYVAPTGARAASAGTFVTMAAHVAAMAPGTRIGVATPVSGEGTELPEDVRTKAINDTVAYARIIAEQRGRNAEWAEDAVRDAVAATADEALALDVIDLIAEDRTELLAAMDGIRVELRSGPVTLATAAAAVEERPMSAIEEILMALADPNIALLLLSLGTLGIYFELSNPGAFFPGIAGAIALILAFFSLGTLPINYAGLALVILGLSLLGAEIWVASGGVLGVGGAVAFMLGALVLIDDTQAPFLEISRPLIYGMTLALVLFVLFAVRAVMRTRRRPAFIGGNEMVGAEAVARAPNAVFIEGELWRARSNEPLAVGDRVRIVGREGLDLLVETLPGEAAEKET